MRQRFDSSFKLSAWISKNSFLSGSISRNLPLTGSFPILPRIRSSTISSKTMRSASDCTTCSLRMMQSKVMVRQERSMMVSFSFFMLNSSLSCISRYLSLLGRKLRLLQLRWNCSTSWRSQASMREISSWTSFSFLKGMEASWQRELQRESFLRAGLSISKLMSTLVFRISLSSAELPYLAFSRKDSDTQSALFSQLPLRNMPSAMASLSTDICPSFIQAAVSRVGMRSSISCSFSLMSHPVNRPCLISRLYSSICMLAVRASSFPLTSWKRASASLRSFSSMALSSSIKQDLTLSWGSRRAMKLSRSVRIRAQSADLRMPTMDRMELSVYFSWALSWEMREMVDLSQSVRPF